MGELLHEGVERDAELGGLARRVRHTLDGLDVQATLRDLIREVYQHPLVHVSHSATITDVSGFVGQFPAWFLEEMAKHSAADFSDAE